MIGVLAELAKLAIDCAPSVAGCFLSPAAGVALNLLSDKVGGKISDPQSILEALKASPSVSETLLELETKYGALLKSFMVKNRPSCVKITVEINWPESTQGNMS